jgi:hypothetical protein
MEKSDPLWLRDRAMALRNMSFSGDDMQLRVALLELAEEFDLEATEIEAKAINLRLVKDGFGGVPLLYS